MKKISLAVLLVLFLVAIVATSLSLIVVQENERAIVGASANNRAILMPGLHFKWPWLPMQKIFVNHNEDFAVTLPTGEEDLQFSVFWDINAINSFLEANLNDDSTLELIKTETQKWLVQAPSNLINDPQNLSTSLLKFLQSDPLLLQKGIQIKIVWLKSINPNGALEAKIFDNMRGLAATIGQNIVENGQTQAGKIRSEAEQNFLVAQDKALKEAAIVLGQGNSAAVKTIAALYHQNPALFKAYVAAKVKLLSDSAGS